MSMEVNRYHRTWPFFAMMVVSLPHDVLSCGEHDSLG